MSVTSGSFGPVFLHFFDIHFLEERGHRKPGRAVIEELKLATRLAIAASEYVYVPAASYIESTVCKLVLDELAELFRYGVVRLVGSASNLEEFKESKLSSYRRDSPIHLRYAAPLHQEEAPSFQQKYSTTTVDLGGYWRAQLGDAQTVPNLLHGTDIVLPEDFEKTWDRVPDRLEKLAFVLDHVKGVLGQIPEHLVLTNRLRTVINQGYFASYTNELGATVVDDLVYLSTPYAIPVPSTPIPYRATIRRMQQRDSHLLQRLRTCPPSQLLRLKDEPNWSIVIEEAVRYHRPGRVLPQFAPPAKDVDVLIMTALEEERGAFHAQLPDAEGGPDSYNNVVYWTRVTRGGPQAALFPYSVAFVTLPQMGRVPAATGMSQLLSYLKPRYVLLVGIAGGLIEKVKLGDVLVAQPIIDYEPQKLHPKEPEWRFEVFNASTMLLNAARNVSHETWKLQVLEARPEAGAPTVHIGPVASGDKLVQDWSGFGELKRRYPKLLGVEMEGGGAAYAAHAGVFPPQFIMIRGVSDYADVDKNAPSTKAWRRYACSAAAAYALALLRQGLLK